MNIVGGDGNFKLAPGETQVVSIRFQPSSPAGVKTDTLSILHDATNVSSPINIHLVGGAHADGTYFVDANPFALTVDRFEYDEDWDGIVSELSNSEYRVADWDDLEAFHQAGNNLHAILDELGVSAGIVGSVTRNGNPIHGSSGGYFAVRHNGDPPPNLLVHAEIGSHFLSLSSGFEARRILAINRTYSVFLEDNLVPTAKYAELLQNYPNPFSSNTIVHFTVPRTGYVRLEIIDLTGKSVKVLTNGHVAGGRHSVTVDARELSSGIYIYRLITDHATAIRRMIVLR